jgi:hypothetical protein
LLEVIHHLLEGRLFCGSANGVHIGKGEKIESPLEEIADPPFIQDIQSPIKNMAMDFFDRLVNQEAEEDYR